MATNISETWPLVHSKKRSRTMAVPTAASQAAAMPVVSVEVDTPTYLEVPDFQRVAVIGDYAAGVLFIFLYCCVLKN